MQVYKTKIINTNSFAGHIVIQLGYFSKVQKISDDIQDDESLNISKNKRQKYFRRL